MTGLVVVVLAVGGLVVAVEVCRWFVRWFDGDAAVCRACGGTGWSRHPAVTVGGWCSKCAGTGRVTRS